LARGVPKVKNLHDPRVFMNSVVNQDRRMDKLTDTGPARNRTPNIGERLQQIDVVKNVVSEAFSSRRKVEPRVLDYFFEIG
jgi:hypothetical protein